MSEEVDGNNVLWVLVYYDAFCWTRIPFYAPSQDEAVQRVVQWIESLPYQVIQKSLYTYPGRLEVQDARLRGKASTTASFS